MADPGLEAAKVPGIIPHFFFDAIGRIVPGVFLLVGLAWTRPELRDKLFSPWSTDERVSSWSGTGLVLFFLIFLIASYFLGFLLGSLSQPIVEKGVFAWLLPLDLKWLRRWMGVQQGKARVEDVYEGVFGGALADDCALLYRQSWLCAYYVWQNNQNLGLMGSRWDAEALSSGSIVLASAILILVTPEWCVEWIKLVVFGVILVGALFGYSYHRKKRLVGRFDLFLAVRRLRIVHGLEGQTESSTSGKNSAEP